MATSRVCLLRKPPSSRGQRDSAKPKGRRRRAGPKSAGFVVEATPVPADDGVVAAAIVPVNEAACVKPLPQRR